MKFFGKTLIYTAVIFIVIILLNLVINPGKVASVFEKGVMPGIGVILSALILLYLVALISSFVGGKLRAKN